MSERLEQAWCPTCKEWTVLDADRPCAWCDTRLIRRRGGWKRPDRYRFTRQQLEKMAALHERGVSLRVLARSLWQRLGYSSENSCLETLRESFRREGLPIRSQSAATAAANRARGRKRLPGEDKNAYKRRMRREVGYRDSRTGQWKRVAG